MAAKKKEEHTDSKSLLKNILQQNKDSHYNYVQPKQVVIPSGSLALDSLVKIRTGSFVRMCGKGSELGKTSECLVLAENFMKTMPKSKTIFVKAEARLSPEMQERSGLKYVIDSDEWDYGTVFVFGTNEFELIASTLETMIPSMHEDGEHLCVILDSLDGVILRSDKEKDLWGGDESVKVAGVPLLTKILFKRLALQVVHYDVLFIITSQYTSEIKLDPYAKTPPRQTDGSGGFAINHQSDVTLSYQPRFPSTDIILEKPNEKPDPIKNKKLGVYATVEVRKSPTDVTGHRVRIPIKSDRIGCAIWVEKELVDMIVAFGLVTKRGSWFQFSEEIIDLALKDGVNIKAQHQGMNALYKYVEDDVKAFEWLLQKIKDII